MSERPRSAVGPNWYAAVMGTAIVANAGATLPVSGVPGLRAAAVVVWALSVLVLAVVFALRVWHVLRRRGELGAQLLDPAVAPFFGCAPMALLAVGAGTLLVGGDVIGGRAALAVDVVLWTVGTVLAVAVAAALPYLMIFRHDLPVGSAAPIWLLPVVGPMVAAATGPLLIPHLPAGEPRHTMLLGCYALFGMSLLATLILLPGIWSRLVHHKLGPAVLVPTLFLVLGPLGQSITAVNQLADVAAPADRDAWVTLAEGYGIPVLGFALLWLAIAGAATLRVLRRRELPFAPTWWAFTFPVGTCVTGTRTLRLVLAPALSPAATR